MCGNHIQVWYLVSNGFMRHPVSLSSLIRRCISYHSMHQQKFLLYLYIGLHKREDLHLSALSCSTRCTVSSFTQNQFGGTFGTCKSGLIGFSFFLSFQFSFFPLWKCFLPFKVSSLFVRLLTSFVQLSMSCVLVVFTNA